MIVKGIISAINLDSNTIDVILPEYQNVIVKISKTYRQDLINTLKIKDFVLVVVFNDDFNDCIII